MAELKTRKNKKNVQHFLKAVSDAGRQKDCLTILEMMQKITGEKPAMWGDSIIGFGSYHYRYATGREGDWFFIGFSPRKQSISIYTMCGLESDSDMLARLGKFKTGKSCLYINKLEDINLPVLEKLLTKSVRRLSHRKS